jgi:hypothetical protein
MRRSRVRSPSSPPDLSNLLIEQALSLFGVVVLAPCTQTVYPRRRQWAIRSKRHAYLHKNVSGSEFDNLQRTLGPSHKPSRVRGNTPVISAAFKAFCAEKRGAGAWKDAEHSERYDYGPIVAELIKVAGDRSMGSLAIDRLRLFKDRVLADGTSPTNKAKKLALPAVRQSVGAARPPAPR